MRLLLFFLIILSFPKDIYSDESEDLIAIKQSYQDGFYNLALSAIRAFLKKYPHSKFKDEVLLFKGCSLLKLKRFPQAVEIFRMLRLSSNSEVKAQALFYLGKINSISKDYNKAKQYFQEVIEKFPQQIIAFSAKDELALIFYNNKEYQKAAKLWEELIKKDIKKDIKRKIVTNLIYCYLENNQFKKANKFIAQLDKEFARSFFNAFLFYKKGNLKKAKKLLEELIKQNLIPREKNEALLLLAWCLIDQDKFAEALEILEKLKEDKHTRRDEVLYALAKLFYKKGSYEEAARYYLLLINKYPLSSRREISYMEIFDCYYNLNKYQNAQRIAVRFFREYPKSLYYDDFHYNLGWLYYKEGNFEKALSEYQWIIDNSPDVELKINAYCRIGDILSEEGKIDQAIEAYNIVLKRYPDSLSAEYAQYRLGIELLEKGEWDSAILSLRAVLVNFPASRLADRVHYNLAVAYMKKGDYKNSLEEVEILLKEFPHTDLFSQALLLKAILLYNLTEYQKALDFLNNYSSKIKDRVYLHFLKAQILSSLNKFSDAEKEFNWLLTNVKQRDLIPYLYLQRGEFNYSQQKWQQALKDFIKAEQTSQEREVRVEAVYWQGWCYYKMQDLAKAASRFLKLTTNDSPRRLAASYYAAVVFMEMGRYEKAFQLFAKLLDVESKYRKLAEIKIADIYRKLGDYEQAIKHYSKLSAEYDAIGAEAVFKIGEIFEEKGDFDNAILYYIRVSSLYHSSKLWRNRARLRSARLLEKQARYTEAKKIYQQLIKEGGEESIYAQERLEWLKKFK